MYAITVHQMEGGRMVDLAFFTEAATAPEMEEAVTRLHREFPAPGFVVRVENR